MGEGWVQPTKESEREETTNYDLDGRVFWREGWFLIVTFYNEDRFRFSKNKLALPCKGRFLFILVNLNLAVASLGIYGVSIHH